MNNIARFSGALVSALACIAVSIYYLVPGYEHVLVTHDATHSHPTHAFAFFALAGICVIVALVSRPKAAKPVHHTGNEEDHL